MNDWVRNCCKECSDKEGWYYNQNYENASDEEKRNIAEACAAENSRKEAAEAARAERARLLKQLMRLHERELKRQRELLKQS